MDENSLNGELDAIGDIIESMRVVKGEQFAMLAVASFETQQIIEVFSILSDMADQDGKHGEFIGELLSATFNLSKSLLEKVGAGLSKEDAMEAFQMGSTIMDRKVSMQKQFGEQR